MQLLNEENRNGTANVKRAHLRAWQRWEGLRRFFDVLMRSLSAWAV